MPFMPGMATTTTVTNSEWSFPVEEEEASAVAEEETAEDAAVDLPPDALSTESLSQVKALTFYPFLVFIETLIMFQASRPPEAGRT